MAITPLQSRIEEILSGSKTITPQSRIEVLLIELIEAIEESGEASAYHYKGSVNSVNDLPESAEVGDVYNVIATGMNYAWTGTEWDSLGWLVEVISTILENSQSPVTSAAIYSALAGKVNTEQGKGLSTNDFTNADKANLATALEKANAAAPQATTYTKSQVDAALAAKLNTADVDAALSSTSTNPVQNKAVRAPIARLVDAGAKNIADMSKTSFTSLTKGGVTVTLSGDTFTSSGTSTSDVNNFFNVFYVGMSTVMIPPGRWVAMLEGTGIENFRVEEFDSYNGTALKGEFGEPFHFEIHAGVTVSYLRITTKPGTICDGNFRLMICKEEDYSVSPEFVPYAKSNFELTQVTESIPRLVDAGTKNLLNLATPDTVNRATVTDVGDGAVMISCTDAAWANSGYECLLVAGKSYKLIIYVDSASVASVYFQCFVVDITGDEQVQLGRTQRITSTGAFSVDFTASSKVRIGININNSSTIASGSATIRAMICTAEDYDISPEFVPYAPSNRELYEMILALQNAQNGG